MNSDPGLIEIARAIAAGLTRNEYDNHVRHALTLLVAGCASPAASPSAAPPDDMVHVPAGTLVRGHEDADRLDESPPQTLMIPEFAIDRTLVTRAEFERFVTATNYVTTAEKKGFGVAAKEGMDDWEWRRVPNGSWRRPFVEEDAESRAFLRPDAPVVMVSWNDAVAYCTWRHARLPTEAEWEYAMRAGSMGTRYPWGESPERDGKISLNYWQGDSHRANTRADGFVYVSPVKAFPPNAWGIYDPVGNVWQWTNDYYSPTAYSSPVPPKSGTARVLRGGSWWCGACTCEGNGLHYRGKADPLATFNNNGFRCARDE